MNTPKNRPACPPLARKADHRWLAFATAGTATLAGNADAALVQITQTNIHAGGNFISSISNSISTDLTGDGNADVGWSGNTGAAWVNGSDIGSAPGGVLGYVWLPPTPFGGPGSIANMLLKSPVTAPVNYFNAPTPAAISGLVTVSFTDALLGPTTFSALAELVVASDGTASGSRVTITRLIFDDADPTGAALPTIGTVAPSYAEAAPIPEPSNLALLTLGAGGLLLRRKRKQAA